MLEAIRLNWPLPSIMMSGQASKAEADQALHAGVFTFLKKPLDLIQLRGTVDMLIRHHYGTPRRHDPSS